MGSKWIRKSSEDKTGLMKAKADESAKAPAAAQKMDGQKPSGKSMRSKMYGAKE